MAGMHQSIHEWITTYVATGSGADQSVAVDSKNSFVTIKHWTTYVATSKVGMP